MKSRLFWITSILFLFAISSCGKSEPSPDCETLPGMPDRPCTPEEVIQPNYREDTPEAIGATGRPQLLVFYAPASQDNFEPDKFKPSCINCEKVRPMIQALEKEFWGQVDFVYLRMDQEANLETMEAFEIVRESFTLTVRNASKPNLFFLSPEGEILRKIQSGSRLGQEPKESDIRYSIENYFQ